MSKNRYRVWDKRAKKYRKLDSIVFDDTGDVIYVTTLDPDTGHDPWDCAIEDVELEQSTGLEDKNGKEIYEGDIVKVPKDIAVYLYPVNYHRNPSFVGEVVFSKGTFRAGRGEKVGELAYSLYSLDETRVEVIGNIHENPELLGKGVTMT